MILMLLYPLSRYYRKTFHLVLDVSFHCYDPTPAKQPGRLYIRQPGCLLFTRRRLTSSLLLMIIHWAAVPYPG